MGKSRLEAFSDGVIAILITIMVFELKVPHAPELSALGPMWPVFLSYVLSFIRLAVLHALAKRMFPALAAVRYTVINQ